MLKQSMIQTSHVLKYIYIFKMDKLMQKLKMLDPKHFKGPKCKDYFRK